MTKDDLVGFIKKSPVVVACAVLSIGLIAAWYFRSDKIPEAETQLAEKSSEADRYALNLKNAAHLKEDYETLVAANKAIDARLLRPKDLLINSQFFYQLVNDTGVKLLDLRQTTPTTVAKPAKGTVVPVAFAVSVEGTLPQLLDFLRKIEVGAHYSREISASCGVNVSKRNSPLALSLSVELLGIP